MRICDYLSGGEDDDGVMDWKVKGVRGQSAGFLAVSVINAERARTGRSSLKERSDLFLTPPALQDREGRHS